MVLMWCQVWHTDLATLGSGINICTADRIEFTMHESRTTKTNVLTAMNIELNAIADDNRRYIDEPLFKDLNDSAIIVGVVVGRSLLISTIKIPFCLPSTIRFVLNLENHPKIKFLDNVPYISIDCYFRCASTPH